MSTARTWSGSRLKEIREREGLTREGLSHRIPTSVANIYRWERGTVTPGADMAALVADRLGVDINEFFENGKEAA